MISRCGFMRGLRLWRAAPAPPLRHVRAWWQVRAGATAFDHYDTNVSWGRPFWLHTAGMVQETSGDGEGEQRSRGSSSQLRVSVEEVHQVLRHVNLASLKHKLAHETRDYMDLSELLELCEMERVASDVNEAAQVVRSLDHAGVVFTFRNKVFLHPEKLADQVAKALPLALALEDDPRKEEYEHLEKMKAKIDGIAHKRVRRNLLAGLGVFTAHFFVFFRLTFWEFSWDVMEPIAFFVTTGALLLGYAYFLTTATDPSYQDLHERLFKYHQNKVMKKMNFDNNRFQFLSKHCRSCFSDTPLGFPPFPMSRRRHDDD